jgi:hypothetical protein
MLLPVCGCMLPPLHQSQAYVVCYNVCPTQRALISVFANRALEPFRPSRQPARRILLAKVMSSDALPDDAEETAYEQHQE